MYLLVADIDYISDRVSKLGGRPSSNPLQIWHPPARTNMLWYSDRQNECAHSPGSKGKGRLGTKQEHLEDPTAGNWIKVPREAKQEPVDIQSVAETLGIVWCHRVPAWGASRPLGSLICALMKLYPGDSMKSVWRTFDFSTTRLLEMVNWVQRC